MDGSSEKLMSFRAKLWRQFSNASAFPSEATTSDAPALCKAIVTSPVPHPSSRHRCPAHDRSAFYQPRQALIAGGPAAAHNKDHAVHQQDPLHCDHASEHGVNGTALAIILHAVTIPAASRSLLSNELLDVSNLQVEW